MQVYKSEFIEFMVRSGVLTFGDFTTKSGRKTPFFINTGNYDTGAKIARLGQYYAEAIHSVLGFDFDNLYGPAYKGIPLCVAASIALARLWEHNVSFTFNRKEAKDHGEGGGLIGYRYKGGERVVIVEDVTTAGTSVRETVGILRSAVPQGVDLRGLVVSVDRMERGTGEKSALAELADEFGLQTFAIATIDEIVEHLTGREINGRVVIDAEMAERIARYREQYGARS
ncbi:orotate phosphoribosyltransferase [Candidatus Sumerlaeota bacterium]|nr:orotate phosphoribosyltransferase [Candidatus Sumerlaeota bacterium]